MRAALPFLPQPVWQTAGSGTAAAKVAGTKGYVDLSLPQQLLQAKAAYDDQIYNRLMEYGAQLQVLGVLAGVFDTTLDGVDGATLRAEVAKVVAAYTTGLLERSKRTSWRQYDSLWDVASISNGLLYKGAGWAASQFGADDTAKSLSRFGDKLIETDPNALIYNVGKDWLEKTIASCLARWDEFWLDVQQKGVLVAMARLKADADFLAGEIALDIAMGVVTGGAAVGIKLVAKRLAGEVTEIAIRVASKVAANVPDANLVRNLKVPDRAIDPKILNEVLDEDKLGTGSKSADVSARGEVPDPAKEKPDGSAPKAPSKKTVRRGSNEQTITYDPQTGRPVSSTGTIRQDFGSGPRYDNATAIGRLGNPGDQGGHLAGHRFFGDTPDEGIAPQAGNLNMGAWKTMENEWADWTKLGYEVEYKVDVYPPGSVRPDAFGSTYQVRDPKTGKVVYKNGKKFKNKPGETFLRVPWREILERYGEVK